MELGETLAHNPDASLPQPEPEQPREIPRVLDLFCGAGGGGCPVWYLSDDDYAKAHAEAVNPPRSHAGTR